MTVYIEYAFLQNFFLDGALLFLSRRVTRLPVSLPRLCASAALGAAFALLFPLLRLTAAAGFLFKLSVGCLLTLCLCKRVKTRKEWGRYALNTLLFFLLTFLFGGAILSGGNSTKSGGKIGVYFAVLSATVLFLTEKLYKKRLVERHIYDCRVILGEKHARVRGFLDSGNLATKNALPVCFLSADVLFDLLGNEILFGEKEGGQVCDEMRIKTVNGESRVPLYKGILELKNSHGEGRKKEVYFARAANMIDREYKIILNGGLEELCG